MKNEIWKNFRGYLGRFLVLLLVLLIMNAAGFILLFSPVIQKNYSGTSPENILNTINQELEEQNELSEQTKTILTENEIWFQEIEEDGTVRTGWDLPSNIPESYSLSEIAVIAKGFLNDYPVFMLNSKDSILMVGYPQNSYFKFTVNYLPTRSIAILPFFILGCVLIDILMIFVFFWRSRKKVLVETGPVAEAVEKLTSKERQILPEEGTLKQIAAQLNHAAEVLEMQDKARADWITGVSHDIRNPLSIIIAASQQITRSAQSPEIQQYGRQIESQTVRIKDLVSDLNLVSELEYDAHPVPFQKISLTRVVREACCNVLNSVDSEKYNLEVDISVDNSQDQTVFGDSRLLVRALENILNNSIYHNPDGCSIPVSVQRDKNEFVILIADTGDGCSSEEIERLNTVTSQESANLDREFNIEHGYGMILVKKIIQIHQGSIVFSDNIPNGLKVIITIPALRN